jgi:hypothetical protein
MKDVLFFGSLLTNEGLRRKEDKFVGRNPHHVSILAQNILNRPRVSPREPRVLSVRCPN